MKKLITPLVCLCFLYSCTEDPIPKKVFQKDGKPEKELKKEDENLDMPSDKEREEKTFQSKSKSGFNSSC